MLARVGAPRRLLMLPVERAPRTLRRVLRACTWLVGAVLVAVSAVHADVRWKHERVTARFAGTPVADAVREIANATGGELRGGVIEPRDVTLDLDAVSLEEALHRLLGAQSFTIRYGDGGRVKTIVLEGGPEAPPPPSETPTAAGVAVETGPTFPIVLSRMFARHRPIKLSEPLAERFGQEKASMPELLEIATADDDGITRALATQAVLSALEREARYRRSFLRSLHQLDADELSSIANGPSGERLEELLEYLAAHSREPTLQKKAGVVLDQIKDARAGEG
jgi:hypothetical protein